MEHNWFFFFENLSRGCSFNKFAINLLIGFRFTAKSFSQNSQFSYTVKRRVSSINIINNKILYFWAISAIANSLYLQ